MPSIVMTGGTNGIGRFAAEQLRQTPQVRLLVGARGPAPAGLDCLPLDLARLASVRGFAAGVDRWVGDRRLDGLVLNAALHFGDTDQRTEDGIETTFAVNHLSQYLLLRLLMPRLAPDAIVVLTTSNLHDPRTNAIAPPRHADAGRLAQGLVERDGANGAGAGLRAYAASKLCNVLTARALARQGGLRVIAFNPGFTPGTQFMRHRSSALQRLMAIAVPVLSLVQRTNTVASGGGYLADLALGRITPPAGVLYASQSKRRLSWPAIADLARDDAAMDKLWRDSAALVGEA